MRMTIREKEVSNHIISQINEPTDTYGRWYIADT
tara:strand:+ start:207 stop:308 length:102 start_codon:yes stop_codon:yes gene_type:complete